MHSPHWQHRKKAHCGEKGKTEARVQQCESGAARPRPISESGRNNSAIRALNWIAKNELPAGGIRVHSESESGYPEVTGYLIPTLLNYEQNSLAIRLARWLISVQLADGSFAGPDGVSYAFDTSQVLRGLLTIVNRLPETREACRKAAEYLCSLALTHSSRGFGSSPSPRIPESIHLYSIPPLLEAASQFDHVEYRKIAENCVRFYFSLPNSFGTKYLTHYLGYSLEAAIDLNRADLAANPLSYLQARQKRDGSVRGRAGVSWVCVPGLAQLAICWYKTGRAEPANAAMGWLERHQEPSGGFTGSKGLWSDYFPRVEVPWATKFYLDAHFLRQEARRAAPR